MGVFGWDYTPGVSPLPDDEFGGSTEVTKFTLCKPLLVTGIFWDEDGYLVEQRECEGGFEQEIVGEYQWDNDRTEEENLRAAALAYDQIKGRARP